MPVNKHVEANSHSPVTLVSDLKLPSSTSTTESSPCSTPQRMRSRQRIKVTFSTIDVIVLPYYSEDLHPFPSTELAWEPSDRYTITVNSLEETRLLADRYGDNRSPLELFHLIRNSRRRNSSNSPPQVVKIDEKSKSAKGEFQAHGNFVNTRNLIMRWALVLVCSYIMFSAPHQVCHQYPSHQALKKMLGLGTIKGIEAEVSKRKREWMKSWTDQKVQ